MPKIAVLGVGGMLGRAVHDLFLKQDYNLLGVTRKELDAEFATKKDVAILLRGCDYVINCIGVIKPYIHGDDPVEVARAVRVNALFPYILAGATESIGAKVIQIATDCVYDGTRGRYAESDQHNASDVYGKTKSLGEISAPHFLNLRTSIIGREEKNFLSLLEWFLRQPRGAEIKGFRNHYWNGVTVDAFSKICLGIVSSSWWLSGVQHLVPNDSVSKAQLLFLFARFFKREDISILAENAIFRIDRTLDTVFKDANKKLWLAAGYEAIPNIEQLIKETA